MFLLTGVNSMGKVLPYNTHDFLHFGMNFSILKFGKFFHGISKQKWLGKLFFHSEGVKNHIPYARLYKPGLVYFPPIFHAVYTVECTVVIS